jgi:glutathione S-transferase
MWMNMIRLYQLPAPWDVCSASPFCAKLEAFLRWQNIPYESIIVRSRKGAPKNKIPYIDMDGRRIGDSGIIIETLIHERNLNPHAGLTAEQLAAARSFRYLCEESLYWAMVHFRFIDEAGWQQIRKAYFAFLPAWLRPIAEWKVRGYVREMLHMQGMGRHTGDEIAGIACGDLTALSEYLGHKPYFFGDTMTLTDIVVFSIVVNFLSGPFDNAVTRHARTLANLAVHTDRVRSRCFGASDNTAAA